MPSTSGASYYAAIEYGFYRMWGFSMVQIHCDNEFQAAMDPIAALQSPPIQTLKSMFPEAEQSNNVIKEQVP